jgi:hypothetical protein
MNVRVNALRRKRESLISQAKTQRGEVADLALHLQSRLRLVDMGIAIIQAIRSHPILVATSATMLLPTSRSKLLYWSSRLFTAWEIYTLVRTQWRSTEQVKV